MSHRSSIGGIVVPLVLGLALTAVLGYQAYDADRSHERVAVESLTEQAGFAAWEFARQASEAIDRSLLDLGMSALREADFDEEDERLDLERFRRTRRWRHSESVVGIYRFVESDDAVATDGEGRAAGSLDADRPPRRARPARA
jgi:hypothetical protein